MIHKTLFQTIVLLLSLFAAALAGVAQSPSKAAKGTSKATVGATQPVVGGGTPGQLTKWTGLTSTTNSIGDSTINEDKYGNLGVGTATTTSKLTVAGTIETTSGGVKFPDGSTQTTAGISSVAHDGTLAGNGTVALPLGIAPGGVGTVQLANSAVTAPKISAGAVGNQQIADSAVNAAKLADGSVTGAKIATMAVGTSQLADSAVNAAKLADGSVTGAKIANFAVGTAQLADAAVTGQKIAAASIGTTHLVDSAITSPKLAAGAVETVHLADSAVTAPKIAAGQVLKSLNGITDNVQLVAGSNVTLTPSGNTVTISAAGVQEGSTATQAYEATAVVGPRNTDNLSTSFPVPDGKRLVIEYVSAMAVTLNAEPECTFTISTKIGGQPRMNHFIPAAFSAFDRDLIGRRQFIIGQVTKLYSDEAVGFSFSAFLATESSLEVTISGYLVNLP